MQSSGRLRDAAVVDDVEMAAVDAAGFQRLDDVAAVLVAAVLGAIGLSGGLAATSGSRS